MERVLYKRLLSEYSSIRPDQDLRLQLENWELIKNNLNRFIKLTDFENVSENYKDHIELSIKDVKKLFARALSKKIKDNNQWDEVIQGVKDLQESDLKEAQEEEYQRLLKILDLPQKQPA